MMRLVSFALCLLFVVSTATFLVGSFPEEENNIQPLISWTGPESQIKEKKFVRIKNEKEWETVWLEHLGKDRNQAFVDSDTQFKIDFDKCEVVAMFDGSGWNSRGFRFEEIQETKDTISIHFDRISYQTSGVDGGGVRVTPFAFIVFPKSDKTYTLLQDTQGLKNQPAKWTKRAVLKSG